MKSVEEFLSYLDELNIKLWIDEVNAPAQDVRLLYNAPKGTLVTDISAQLAERKDEIITFLRTTNLASTFTVEPIRRLSGEVLKTQLNYWLSQLHGVPSLLQLPTDRTRPSVQTYHGRTESFTLSRDLTQKLQSLSGKSGTTLFMTLLAAFATLLYRYSGQSDILIGSPIANRRRSEIESLIGFFVNTLVLRTRFEDNPSFESLLAQVRETTLEAYEHQDVPFEQLVEALQPQHSLSHSPLYQAMFVLQNTPMSELKLPGCTWCELNPENTITRYDLTLSITETDEGLVGSWEYNTDLFDGSTIKRMAAHFQNLCSAIVENPVAPVDELPLLSEAERHQLLVEWNDTALPYPTDKSIHYLFEEQVERTPDAVAVVFENQQLTYEQLNRRANQLAHHLQSKGVKPEVLVGICVERSIEMVVGLLGILKAGGAYVPLDPSYPTERISNMLADSGVEVLLTQRSLQKSLLPHIAQVVCLDSDWGAVEQHSQENLNVGVCCDNLAYVIYTSGSTGQPKGVAIEHKSIVNYVCSIIKTINIKQSSNFALVSTISADLSNTIIFPCLFTGGCLDIISQEIVSDPNAISEYFSSHQVDYLKIVPSHLAVLQTSSKPALVLPSQTLILGGEASNSDWVEKIQAQSPNCNIMNHYGPTEATVGVLTYFLDKKSLPLSSSTLPIGRPIANTQIYILDSQMQPVPIGVTGELHIGGDGLARGYLNRPELTQEKFIPNPFRQEAGARLYKTGDLVRYLNDGNIEFLGRRDQQVKIRGFRIELLEIEAVLNTHPQIRQAVVIATEDNPGSKRLVAYVVPQPKSATTVNVIRYFVKEKLPEFMIPSTIVVLKELPLSPNGKVDRKALPPLEQVTSDLIEEVVSPRTPVEETLAQIWAEVLKVEKVGIYDNFFELGGHSLLTTLLVAKVKQAFKLNISLRSFLEKPTVAGLAENIAQVSQTEAYSSTLDIKAETVLDKTIYPQSLSKFVSDPKAILLTGATGFLGAFLLTELLQQTKADIYCLIRSQNLEDSQTKLKTILKSYGIWNENWSSRIIPIDGDLAKPLLGLETKKFQKLASTIDVIYHNGAWVHHIYPYSILKPANVLGTQEILRLASQIKTKPVHFISSSSVVASKVESDVKLVREQDSLNENEFPSNGYCQTKWVAEKLVQTALERGIPISIYRPSRIAGHSETGVFNNNDFLYKLIIGCVQLGSLPDIDIRANIVPVDYVSKAIVHLSKQKKSLGQTFHLVHPQTLHSSMLIDHIQSLGYSIEQISYDQWREKLLNITQGSLEHPLYSLVPFFPARQAQEKKSNSGFLQLDNQNVIDGLVGTSITCPSIDNRLLNVYFSHLINQGFLSRLSAYN